jgi:hypothetical protein
MRVYLIHIFLFSSRHERRVLMQKRVIVPSEGLDLIRASHLYAWFGAGASPCVNETIPTTYRSDCMYHPC